jgi:hypothetical protein
VIVGKTVKMSQILKVSVLVLTEGGLAFKKYVVNCYREGTCHAP